MSNQYTKSTTLGVNFNLETVSCLLMASFRLFSLRVNKTYCKPVIRLHAIYHLQKVIYLVQPNGTPLHKNRKKTIVIAYMENTKFCDVL